eukprot:gnl/MRDRNA2_/MRDRNA2_248539_c0_seq1.p1 gnl/MRDRNA2_/MRDRNA2_248539_c0~~gnl/MRDRNA2_/MRDRNA2_248539_c0_seq1.p1  ORF type:complete len:116 (+),score=14.06 gnl/MRDRNA2_/MRDRNA2_248539_c0_seq1:32-349(+)
MPTSACPRGRLCAFWHRKSQQRNQQGDAEFDYKTPLSKEQVDPNGPNIQSDFLSPPFELLSSLQAEVKGQGMKTPSVPAFPPMLPQTASSSSNGYWPIPVAVGGS